MSQDKEFLVVLQVIISRLVQMISKEMNISDKDALNRLYLSKLYEKLEQEQTKVWHFSVPTLFAIFLNEELTGKLTFPEGV